MLAYPQWVTTKGLRVLLDHCGGASCSPLCLFPCKLPKCIFCSSLETTIYCAAPPTPVFLAIAAVFVPLPFWVFILSNLVHHMVCLSLTLTLGHLNEISSWDLLWFFCKVNLFTASVNSAWSILNALCICLFFSNPLTWLLFFLLPSVL